MNLNTNCSMITESTDGSAFQMASGVTVNMNNHAHVGVVGPGGTGSSLGSGGWFMSGQATLMDTTSDPAASENPINVTNMRDPLANVIAPTSSNGYVTGGTQSNRAVRYDKDSMPPGNMLQPGIYCGGISVGDTGGATLTLASGVYVMAGGGLSLESSAHVNGSAVTIYNSTGSAWGCSSSAAGNLKIVATANVVLSAPTSSTSYTEGILFMEDRSISGLGNEIAGSSSSTFDGALYFKNSSMKFAGNNATHGYLFLVADTIDINGSTTLGNNYSSLSTPHPFAPTGTGGGLVR
jgi:hypothetical protein